MRVAFLRFPPACGEGGKEDDEDMPHAERVILMKHAGLTREQAEAEASRWAERNDDGTWSVLGPNGEVR